MDLPGNPNCTNLSAEKLIALAAQWRLHAGETTDNYYVELMLRTAAELERKAHELG